MIKNKMNGKKGKTGVKLAQFRQTKTFEGSIKKL